MKEGGKKERRKEKTAKERREAGKNEIRKDGRKKGEKVKKGRKGEGEKINPSSPFSLPFSSPSSHSLLLLFSSLTLP